MPFGLGFPELCLIFGIGAIVFGGKRIADIGKGMGSAISNFKRGLREVDEEQKK